MILEVNTHYLKDKDRLKTRVLRAKARLVQMGFYEITPLFKNEYPGKYEKFQLSSLLYCKIASEEFTNQLEALVDKLSQE